MQLSDVEISEFASRIELNKVKLRKLFSSYVKRFYSKDSKSNANANYLMKEKHTYLVCDEIVAIGKSMNISMEQLFIAESAALFHDVGRFFQYAHYQTFVDRRSENHAELGVRIIEQEKFLDLLCDKNKKIVLDAVLYHNRASIPMNLDQETAMILKMLRDADKIDIWRVVTEYYFESSKKRNTAIELNLPDVKELSDPVVDDILNEKLVVTEHLHTLNDFKALQMGWVFDLNFAHSYQMLYERKYLEIIRDTITDPEKANLIYNKTSTYLRSRLVE